MIAPPNFTTKRHRTDRNRDTQTTERGHKHTEQATGQARGHTHHSPPRIPTLKQRLNRPPSGPPSQGQPGRQRSPEPQRRPRAQAPAHHHARAAPHPTHTVHPAHPSIPQPRPVADAVRNRCRASSRATKTPKLRLTCATMQLRTSASVRPPHRRHTRLARALATAAISECTSADASP